MALKGIATVVANAVKDTKKAREEVPMPISALRYFGKFQARTTRERHRLLAMQAAEAGVSINRLVNDRRLFARSRGKTGLQPVDMQLTLTVRSG